MVEDDEDIQVLIETAFSLDSRFTLAGTSTTAEDAFELARTNDADLIVLDQGLAGALTGLEAAPRFKEVAPKAKIILFTARADLLVEAALEPAVDSFLLKTNAAMLLRVAQELLGTGGSAV